jgi:hypothetical protein
LQFAAGAPRVVFVDDADALSEDVGLLEYLVDAFDATGWTLVMAGRPTVMRHIYDSKSSLTFRMARISLRPGWRDIEACLTAGGRFEDLLPDKLEDQVSLIMETIRLTGGSLLLISSLARILRRRASDDGSKSLEITLVALREALNQFRFLSFGDTNVAALTRISAADLERALALIPYARFSVREIAVSRLLSVRTEADYPSDPPADSKSIDNEVDRVVADIEELEQLGLVARGDLDGAVPFQVTDSSLAPVVYEVASRDLLNRSTSGLPYGSSYAELVGGAFARSIIKGACEVLTQATKLATVHQQGTREPRQRSDELSSFVSAIQRGDKPDFSSVYVEAASDSGRDGDGGGLVIKDFLLSGAGELVLVQGSVQGETRQAQRLEVWLCAAGSEKVDNALFDQLAAKEAGFEFAGLKSSGFQSSTLKDGDALLLACALDPAGRVPRLIVELYEQGSMKDAYALARASVESADRFGTYQVSNRGHLGEMRNRLGFLALSLGEYGVAQQELEAVVEWSHTSGSDAEWLHRWNLAQALAGQGLHREAREALEAINSSLVKDQRGGVFIRSVSPSGSVGFLIQDAFSASSLQQLIDAQKELLLPAGEGRLSAADLAASGCDTVRQLGDALLNQTGI